MNGEMLNDYKSLLGKCLQKTSFFWRMEKASKVIRNF